MKKITLILFLGLGVFLLPHFSHALTFAQATGNNINSFTVTAGITLSSSTSYYVWTNATGSLAVAQTCTAPIMNANDAYGNQVYFDNFVSLGGGLYSMSVNYSGLAYCLGGISGPATLVASSSPGNVTMYTQGDNGSLYDFCTNTSCGNIPVSVGFNFPLNGTTVTDFNNWNLNIANVTSSDQYSVVVDYATTPTYLYGVNTFQDTENYNFGVSSGLLTKSHSLIDAYNSSTLWYATASLYDQTEGNLLVATSSQILFTVLNNGIFTLVNTSGNSTTSASGYAPNYVVNQVQNVNENCTAPTSSIFSDPAQYTASSLAYGLCNVSIFLFVPTTNVQNYMNGAVSNIEGVMPFSLGFGILNSVESSVSSAPAEQDLTWQMDAGSAGTVPITMISSSTLTTAFGSSNKNLLFTWEDYFFWIMTLMAMFFTVYGFIHRIAGHKPQKINRH